MKQEILTACPLDCWDACSVVAYVEDGRVVELRGNPHHPITRGFLCGKTVRYPQRAYSSNRILHPMLRRAGDDRAEPAAFERITWDQALEMAAGRIGECLEAGAPESILHYQSAGSMGLLKKLSKRFFSLLGGATEPAGDICFGAGELAQTRCFGEQTAHSPEDMLSSRLILLWGRNPLVSNTHMLPLLDQARRRGAMIVAVNPRRIDRAGKRLDWQLQPLPGRDVFLALALLREFIARGWCDASFIAEAAGWEAFREFVASRGASEWLAPSGVSPEEFERLLVLYRDCHPAGIWVGSGAQHNVLGVELVEALAALAAAAGNVGVPGGGLNFFPKHRKHFDLSWFSPNPRARFREVPAGEFWKPLPELDPPIRLMWINGANPVRSLPDSRAVARAIRATPFVVAVDFHWTDTVRCAGLVLPHVSFLEEGGLVSSYGHNYAALMQPVSERVGEARTDLEIFQDLAARLGFGEAMAGSERQWTDRFMAPLFARDASLREKFYRDGYIENPLLPRVANAGSRFCTASGKFQFPAPFSIELERLPGPSPEFPLRLLTNKDKRFLNSQLEMEREAERYEVKVHPETAAALQLAAGGEVCIRSATGSVPAVLQCDGTLRPGVAWMGTSGSAARGTSVNLLVSARMAGDGACPAYNDTFVRIEPAS